MKLAKIKTEKIALCPYCKVEIDNYSIKGEKFQCPECYRTIKNAKSQTKNKNLGTKIDFTG